MGLWVGLLTLDSDKLAAESLGHAGIEASQLIGRLLIEGERAEIGPEKGTALFLGCFPFQDHRAQFSFPRYPHCLKQCPAQSRNSVSMC